MATATNYLGHCLYPVPGLKGAQIKRVSVLTGNQQPIGVAQIKRVSVLECNRRVPGIHHSHGSEE